MPAEFSVLLDVDGTLVDSNYVHVDAWALAFAENGHPVPSWRIHRTIGMGGDRFVSELIGEAADAEIGAAVRDAHDELFKRWIGDVQPLPGAHALLQALRELGLAAVLASSAGEAEVLHYLDLLDSRNLVAAWTTADDVEHTKPEPDLIEVAIEKAGVPAVVMVGDSVWDCRAAARAEVPTVVLLSGGISAVELLDAGAHRVYRDAAELTENLEAVVSTLVTRKRVELARE